MKIDILTLFPEMFKGPFDESIIKRAQEKGLVEIKIHNLRNWAIDKRGTVDDRPYGGGVGMVMRVDVIDQAIKEIKNQKSKVKNINQKLKINKKNQKTAEEQTITFKDLLEIINNIKGDFKIGFLTNHPKDMTDELIKTIASLPKIKKEIHLPFQAGSNKILKKMNRHYTKQGYLKLVEKIRKAMPQVRLTTDIIVGFPGETKKDFQDTFEVMKKARFNQAFIAKYSPRTGTAAFNLKDNVPLEEKKKREQILLNILIS